MLPLIPHLASAATGEANQTQQHPRTPIQLGQTPSFSISLFFAHPQGAGGGTRSPARAMGGSWAEPEGSPQSSLSLWPSSLGTAGWCRAPAKPGVRKFLGLHSSVSTFTHTLVSVQLLRPHRKRNCGCCHCKPEVTPDTTPVPASKGLGSQESDFWGQKARRPPHLR